MIVTTIDTVQVIILAPNATEWGLNSGWNKAVSVEDKGDSR